MSYPATFADIVAAVIAKARLDATADLAKTQQWVNEAYSQVCLETEATITSGTVTLTAGTGTYDLSTFLTNAILRIKALSLTSQGVVWPPLKTVSLDTILRKRVSSGGAPTAQAPPSLYSLTGMNVLDLWATPQSADVLTVYYVAAPTVLSGTAVPVIPEPFATKLLEYGALAEAADFKNDPYADQYRNLFEQWIQKFRQHLNRRRGGQPGQFEMWPARELPPHDPSTITAAW